MTVAMVIDDVVWKRLANVAKSKKGGILTTNYGETCYHQFENDGPNERW